MNDMFISENQRPSKKSDIYSYAIILVEVFTREDPYQELRGHMEPTEIIREVMRSHLRPDPKHVQPVTVREVSCTEVNSHLTKANVVFDFFFKF